jgi:hypothetical protein
MMEFLADSLNISNDAFLWILLIGGVVGLILVVVVITIFYFPLRLLFRNLLSRKPESQAVNKAYESQAVNKTSAADQSSKEKKSGLTNILRQGLLTLVVAFGVLISLPFLIFFGLKFLVALIML